MGSCRELVGLAQQIVNRALVFFVSELFSISLLTIDNIYIHDSANFPNIITIDGVESHVLLVS